MPIVKLKLKDTYLGKLHTRFTATKNKNSYKYTTQIHQTSFIGCISIYYPEHAGQWCMKITNCGMNVKYETF